MKILRALAVLAVSCAPAAALSAALQPPQLLLDHLGGLKAIDRIASLPSPIRAGDFSVDRTSAAGWRISDPGGPFSATDVPVPGAPGRRLIFAACDSRICVIHYERGGVAHFYELLALATSSKGWTVIWNARGSKPLANLAALRELLRNPAASKTWDQQWVKGDF